MDSRGVDSYLCAAGRARARPSRVLAFSIEFVPVSFDEPVCLVVGARFAEPTLCRQIWNSWMSSDTLLAALPRNGGSEEVSREHFESGFLPAAHSARAFVVPVCDIVNAESVATKLLAPALALLE